MNDNSYILEPEAKAMHGFINPALEKGVAIEIKYVEKFPGPINPNELFPNFAAPQSWFYLPAEQLNDMKIHLR